MEINERIEYPQLTASTLPGKVQQLEQWAFSTTEKLNYLLAKAGEKNG